jgi:hypothetical protein
VVKRVRSSLAWPLATLAAAAAASLAGLSCSDPVHDQEVAALGPEAPNVPQGPLHRPGQPCNVCHGGIGPANLRFSVAGTVYQYAVSPSPAANGATVQLEDSTGSTWHSTTNAAGNFYVLQSDWAPTYPMTVPGVVYSGTTVTMSTLDNREGSCATCHTMTPGPGSAGQVYINTGAAPNMGGQPDGGS